MTKQLLVDTMPFRLTLKESASGGKLIAHGRFALADVPTANGRVYNRALWTREIKRLSEPMRAKRVFGEADHPADGRTKLTRVAHILLDLELKEDGEIIGTAEIIDTSAGKELKAIIAAGGSIGVSSRGYGSVSKDGNGHDVVEEDYQLDTFDFVVDPAQGSAYPEFRVEDKLKPEGTVKTEGTQTTTDAAASLSGTPKKEDDKPATEPTEEEDDPKDDINSPASATEAVKTQIETAVAKAKAEVREEERSRLLSDPTVAGARLAIESLKGILRPYILDKDVNVALEEKDQRIKALEEQVKALTSHGDKAKVENVALCKAVKDLGFRLYVTKTLAGHPKLESILTSLGDVSLVENIQALQKLVEPHKEGLKLVRTEEVQGSRKLIASKDAEVKRLSEALKTATDTNKKVVAERNEALKTAHNASLRAYLERKIVGNPRSSQIRLKFKEMREKTKDSVDALVEAFAVNRPSKNSDFSRIRARFAKSRPSATLVEDSIEGTGPLSENAGEKVEAIAGVDLDVASINRLAGVKDRAK